MSSQQRPVRTFLASSPLLLKFPALRAVIVPLPGSTPAPSPAPPAGGSTGTVKITVTPASETMPMQSLGLRLSRRRRFFFQGLSFNVGQNLNFSATVAGGVAPFTYAWAFGDGSTSASASAAHAYASAGAFTVSLTVSDAIGNKAVGSVVLDIVQIITALALSVPAYAQTGSAVTLTATLTAAGLALANRSVAFYNGTTLLGTATTNASGVATLTYTVPSTAQTLSVTVQFGGDAVYAAITSLVQSLVVYAPLTVTVGAHQLLQGLLPRQGPIRSRFRTVAGPT